MTEDARTGKRAFLFCLAFAAVAVLLMVSAVGTAPATTLRGTAKAGENTPPAESSQLVGYYDLLESTSDNGTGAGDSILELINPTASNGNLCASKLAMPTAFVAQNGAEIHESTKIAVRGCPKPEAKEKRKAKKAATSGRRRGVGRVE